VLVRIGIGDALNEQAVGRLAGDDDAAFGVGAVLRIEVELRFAMLLVRPVTGKAVVRENRPDIRAILAGTPSRAVSAAGGLCEETPWVVKPYQPQTVHDHIRGLLAARERAQ